MNVGIYNRWLPTLGGGERMSLAIAEHLSHIHSVDVISHSPISAKTVSDRLDISVDRLHFRTVSMPEPLENATFSSQYDLFINASNGDFVAPLAKHNAMLVFFPAAPPKRLGQRARRILSRQIDKLATRPRYMNGVFGLGDELGVKTRGLSQQAQIALPAASVQPYTVEFALTTSEPSVIYASIFVDGELVQEVNLQEADKLQPVKLTIPPGRERTLTIKSSAIPNDGNAPVLFMTPINISSRRARVYAKLFEDIWPELGTRQQNRMPDEIPSIAQRYGSLWAISRYTQQWIRAYWNLPSQLLYPPVPVERFPPRSKKPYILSVGRFFAGNHNKKHLAMVHAFRKMMHEGVSGWELHLAGSVTQGAKHSRYLEKVQEAAAGAPIFIHSDLGNDALTKLFGESSIYWHAAGFGEDPTHQPGKFEHFGISVVEAMAAGCAPVIVGQGGLSELVHHGQDGYLWYTLDELQATTNQLINDEPLRSRIAQSAIVSSRKFDRVVFDQRLDELITRLAAPSP